MRQIILDTETTGLDPRQGHRIIEIAALEVVDRRPTGRHVHFYLNPEREIDAAATEVHGMTWDDLKRQAALPRRRGRALRLPARRGVGHPQRAVRRRLPRRGVRAVRPAGLRSAARAGRRHAGARPRAVPRQAQQPRRAVRALRRGQRGAHAARRAARHAAARRRLPRDDARPGIADDRHRAPHADARAVRSGGAGGPPARPRRCCRAAPTADELAAHAAYLETLDKESKGRCLWLSLRTGGGGRRLTPRRTRVPRCA